MRDRIALFSLIFTADHPEENPMTATNMEKHTLLVYDPTAEETGEQDRLAERLSTFDGVVR